MAAAADIATVRKNVNEPTTDIYSDEYIGGLIDAGSVESASAVIWREKAAAYVDIATSVSEAGASISFKDMSKEALAMAAYFDGISGTDTGKQRAKTHMIVRNT